MDTSRVRSGEVVAGVSGIALVIVLFLPWYGVDLSVAGFAHATGSASAWRAFGFIDILLFMVALVAIGVPLAKAAGTLPPDVPGTLVLVGAGVLGLLLVLYRLVDPPGAALIADDSIQYGPRYGIFLGLAATAGIAYGGWRASVERAADRTTRAAAAALSDRGRQSLRTRARATRTGEP